MCMGSKDMGMVFNPAASFGSDPLTATVAAKASPDAVKDVLNGPAKLAGMAVDGAAGQGTSQSLIQAGDPRGLLNQGKSWNSQAAQTNAKSLLGD